MIPSNGLRPSSLFSLLAFSLFPGFRVGRLRAEPRLLAKGGPSVFLLLKMEASVEASLSMYTPVAIWARRLTFVAVVCCAVVRASASCFFCAGVCLSVSASWRLFLSRGISVDLSAKDKKKDGVRWAARSASRRDERYEDGGSGRIVRLRGRYVR